MNRPKIDDYYDPASMISNDEMYDKYLRGLEKYCDELEEEFKDTLTSNGELINQNWKYFKDNLLLNSKVINLKKALEELIYMCETEDKVVDCLSEKFLKIKDMLSQLKESKDE